MHDILAEINQAESRIRPYTLQTPLLHSRELSNIAAGSVYLKMESEQHTGSFKARGSLNKLMALDTEEKEQGIITASTGNHALGVARALEITGIKGTIFLPENAAASKVSALKSYEVNLEFYGKNSLETELFAKQSAHDRGAVWVSPYDDPQVIGGQGTIGIELCKQMENIDNVLICVGGGGLISGIGTYLKAQSPSTRIVGCLPENSPEMALSLEKGSVVHLPEFQETLSDGSAGGLETDAITFPICQQVVDECLLVNENEIAEGIKFMVHTHKKIIEGAAAVPIAVLKKYKERFKGSKTVIVICGGNIDIEKLKKLI